MDSSTGDLKERQSKSVPPESDLLPPCRVCGDKASGFHYGANTCHGCKGFFRRSLVRKKEFKCKSGDKQCATLRENQIKICPYCRYQRCLSLGMSKQAIRPGRYTYTMRARYLQEARGLDESELSFANSTVALPVIASDHGQCLNEYYPPVSLNQSPDSGDSGFGSPSPSLTKRDYNLDLNNVPSTSKTNYLSTTSVIASIEELEYEHLIDTIIDAHTKFSLNYHLLKDGEDLKAQQEQSYELAKLKESLFGTLNALSRAEYREFFQATGIDIDDRHKRSEMIMDHMERQVMAQVQFAKGINGFADILLGDQRKLLKASIFEMKLFDGHGTYNADLGIKVLPGGLAFQPQDVCYSDDYHIWSRRIDFEKGLNLMDLNFTEIALIKAIILLFTDRLPLDIPAIVEHLQLKVINALRYYLCKTNPNFKKRFARIWNKIINVRTISFMQEDIRKNFKMDFPELKNFPLMYEMCKE